MSAIVLTLVPEQEYGNTMADILLGRAEPGWRLRVIWPYSPDDHPATTPSRGVLTSKEGLLTG
jgi:beta-glucosidase